MMGPWKIPTSTKNKKPKFLSSKLQLKPLEILGFTVINPATNFIELLAVPSKLSSLVA
jgi:hypothetical protein